MKLYNTASKNIEDIVPVNAPQVTVYTCGPTVYDYPHIGNWFTFIRYDLLIRALVQGGFEPKWVMNITDVGHLVSDADDGQDKLEKGAEREGKTAWDVAKYYGDYFIEALDRLHFSQPTEIPKATDHIAEQIEMIQLLESKDHTYIISDGVYFDTSTFAAYAAFANLDIDEQQAGARVEYNPEKRNTSDFALWKFSPQDQKRDMEWDSPWGKGFPGWHIECSAMSRKYLGDTIDIHSGGIDHIPVHHTNEIAQSEAATGKPFAHVWMHTNHILINDEKISKSLGNGITLEDVEAKGFSLQALRMHVIESHYRSQSKFSWESLEAAHNRLKGYQELADLRWQHIESASSETFESTVNRVSPKLSEAILNDLDTPQYLFILSEALPQLIKNYSSKDKVLLESFVGLHFDQTLGLQLLDSLDITEDQKLLLSNREQARSNKDWSQSDKSRDELAKQGIGIRDTAKGAIWYRL